MPWAPRPKASERGEVGFCEYWDISECFPMCSKRAETYKIDEGTLLGEELEHGHDHERGRKCR